MARTETTLSGFVNRRIVAHLCFEFFSNMKPRPSLYLFNWPSNVGGADTKATHLLLLLHRDATVTICHSRTPDLAGETRRADILVSAIGRPGLITADMIKPGAAVVDVGTTPLADRAKVVELFGEHSKRVQSFDAKGSTVVGDVHPDVATVAGALSPVPGGVGPLTITMLLKNTLSAAMSRREGRR